MLNKKLTQSISRKLLIAATASILVVALLPVRIVAAQSCEDLSGADVQACQTRIENCDATLTGSDARFRGGCHNSVYSDFGLSGAQGNQAENGSNFGVSSLDQDCNPAPNQQLNQGNCDILKYIVGFINVLSALVGIVVVIMIAYGGIQYSASKDNPQAAAAAKERIRNAVIALVAYLFMFAFLQYLIPGGVL